MAGTGSGGEQQQWPADLESQFQRIYKLLRGSKMLQAALTSGAKVNVTIHINRGEVLDRGPYVVTVEEVP